MQQEPTKVESTVRMGEFAVGADGDVLRALLGSCLGLVLYDAQTKTGGLAHIVLPSSNGRTTLPAKFVDTAVPALIKEIHRLAGRRLKLVGKIAGGASMFSNQCAETIGKKNIQATESLLDKMEIPIVARHVGGKQGRRMILNTDTGRVVVEIVGADAIEL